ncbi:MULTISPECIES: glycosyltransferase family 2 protein [Prochlorococcus]|uniref:Glycosyl transferase n=1 Tax=Prochlorococcus marinus str. MIT 9314 TaxID=167548 RepID=A0A0A2AIK7_PROMR|nr:glycosyltransferase family 2 protein [Prochlorococcus marinus]KGG00264.1 Glycosyl transferase [Prochlorococcus marinus str. MIT 9314]
MDLSIVTTTYNSGKYSKEFVKRINKIVENKKFSSEIIIVDDGSTDNSLELLKNLVKEISNLKVIELSRNFGHHNALFCGIKNSKGKFVFLIDGDLEEDPEDFYDLHNELIKNNLDMVFGQQLTRRGNNFERFSGNLYYLFLEFIADAKIPHNAVTSRVMTRKYVNSLLSFRESQFVLSGLYELNGFKTKSIFIKKSRRRKSTYNLSRKFQILVRSITNYSDRPLYLLFYLGLIISLISLFMIVYLVLISFIRSVSIPGWLTLVCLSWLGVGITILSNGILAIYLKTIFVEVKKRPRTIIRNIFKKKDKL